MKEQEKGQPNSVPVVSEGRIKDCRFCGRSHERSNCPAFGQVCAYCKKKNHFVAKCPPKSKVSAFQERFYLSIAGVGGKGRETVTLTVRKDDKCAPGYEILFLVDTGADCNLLLVNVYKRVSGAQHLNSLYARGTSALILANGEEHPTERKATLFASRKGQKHQIEVNVVKGGGYEPILSKQTMLDINLIQILDSDHLSVVKKDGDPLFDESTGAFEGLTMLAGRYNITIGVAIKPVVHPPRRLPVAITEQVKRKLEEMTSDGIIEKLNKPTYWLSSMLVVSKPSVEVDGETKIRICLDPRDWMML